MRQCRVLFGVFRSIKIKFWTSSLLAISILSYDERSSGSTFCGASSYQSGVYSAPQNFTYFLNSEVITPNNYSALE